MHKSDAGAVRVDLVDEPALRRAWGEIHRTAALRLDGCLVAEMVHGEAEAFAGIKHDPQFGPVVVFGLGGLLIEILDDVQLALAPISAEHVQRLLRSLRSWPVFEGARGRPRLAVAAFAEVVSRLSWLAFDAGERLRELDLNPVIVGRGGAVAVDARARVRE